MPGKDHKRRGLSTQEAELWAEVTRDVVRGGPGGDMPEPQERSGAGTGRRVERREEPVLSRTQPSTGKNTGIGRDLSEREVRHLSRGRVAIDGVLDLHGMRQREAHAALRRFLLAAQTRGHRYVTIITGKGRRMDRADEGGPGCPDGAGGPDDGGGWGQGDMRERGVLRRVVREWLDGPDLGDVVVGYSTAARGHGGEGALFVHIRRMERAGRDGR